MPWRTVATLGAAWEMRSAMVSSPFTTYLSWQGVLPVGVGLKQSWAIEENPMSLPPIVMLTTAVSTSSESNCGGFGPGLTPWVWVMSSVSAPLHVASRRGSPMRGMARWA